jgi:hypothetical protein
LVVVQELVNLLVLSQDKPAVQGLVGQEITLQEDLELQVKVTLVGLEMAVLQLMAQAAEVAQDLLDLMVPQILVVVVGQDYVQPLQALVFFMRVVVQDP